MTSSAANNAQAAAVTVLKEALADSYLLMGRTQGVHWNVTGPMFFAVHNLTEEHYTNLFTAVDELAERLRALGEKAPYRYADYLALSILSDSGIGEDAGSMIAALVADHQAVASRLRAAVETLEDSGDVVTADMLIGRLSWHEKAVWMLQALAKTS